MPLKSRLASTVDVYAVLGSDRSASWQELRRNYRARARELHPDVQIHRHGQQRLDPQRATRLFSQLQAAWALVATPELRKEYDRATSHRPAAPPKRTQSAKVPAWAAGPPAAVLLRAGPGDLHIAIPGGDWDLSLSAYSAMVSHGRAPGLLIGDIPPHQEVRKALSGLAFVERHRLTTMVGLVEPVEEREDSRDSGDETGAWKLGQLSRAMSHWGRAQPARRRELPYADDLLLMGRLSLAGYELNLPHPAGLFACSEPRPRTRLEAQERRGQAVLELRLPTPTLLLAAFWSGDAELARELARSSPSAADIAAGQGAATVTMRALAGKRPRLDHHDPIWGSVLDRPSAIPESLLELRHFPRAWAWLTERRGLPDQLPWGEPLSLSGRDQALSDAGARLSTRLVERALRVVPATARLVSLRGPSLRLRVPERELTAVAALLRAEVASEVETSLGWRVEPAIL